ncbi:dual specificity protein phosphatase 3-like [Lepeophtheirus salmonis]|uniref:dual specificity protein phosphatase 3-like n=1 Tax=Lepeophtheirus salmonis TaxID=72036 RepID=UPI001AE760EA|nr:dual specificity protein phosphatase 3-like [Lepeophtheirus salmonis]
MHQVRPEELKELLLKIPSPYQITDPKTSLQILKPHRDPEITNPKTIEDVKKFMEALTEDLEANIDEVYPDIYIGNKKILEDIDKLKEMGIKTILNAADGDKGLSYVPKSSLPPLEKYFDYYGLEINDAEVKHNTEILENYETATEIIDSALKKGKILVNCYIGTSRSATCVIFYLIKTKGLTAEEAITLLKKKRDICPSNEGLTHIANYHNFTHGFPLVSGESLPMDPFRRLLRTIYGKLTDC